MIQYYPTIPNPANNPSNDVDLMQVNSGAIYDIINIDHAPFNQANPPSGQHKQLTFAVNQVAPPLGAANSVMYTNMISGFSELFFKNARADMQMTDLTLNAIPGGVVSGSYVDTPWNLRFLFGVTVNPIGSGGQLFTFPNVYASTPFVMISCQDNVSKTCTYSVLSNSSVTLFGFGTGGVRISIWVVGRVA